MGILGKHYLHTVASNVVLKFVVGLVIAVVTARALGPEGRGEYNLLVLIITLSTTLLNFGVPATNTYFTAQKKYGKAALFRSSRNFALVFSLLAFLALGLLYMFNLAGLLFPTEKLSVPIVLSLGIIPVVFFNLFAQGVILGENKIELNNYITLGSQTALAIALSILYFLELLVVPAAIGLYASSHLIAFVTIWITSRPTPADKRSPQLAASDYRKLLGFSITIHLGNLAQFFNYRLDAFIVNYFLGTAAVGLYVIAVTLGETLWLLSSSMAAVLLPTIAAKHERSKELAVKATIATFSISLAAGSVAWFVGPLLIIAMFGEKFAGSVEPFLILIPGIVIFSINNVLATYMTGTGRPGLNAIISSISFVFTIVFDILLIPKLGIAGAAIASDISYAVSSTLAIVVFIKLSRLTSAELRAILGSLPNDVRSAAERMKDRLRNFLITDRAGTE